MKTIALGKKQVGLIAIAIVIFAAEITYAAWSITKDVTMNSGVQTQGDITVYNQDGTQVLSDFGFNLFTGGASNTQNVFFRVKNTGNTPALVTWEISSASIIWTVDTVNTKDFYRHIVGSDTKYTLKINKQSPLSGIWAPQTATEPTAVKQLTIAPGDYASLAIELWYNGAINIPETFTLTVSFHAQNT